MTRIACLQLVLLSFPFLLSAQEMLKTENNRPRENDFFIKEQVDYYPPGDCGQDLVWNFSKAKWNSDYPVCYFTRGDIGLIGAENNKLYSYLLSGDSLLLAGYENPNTLVRYQQPGLLMRFPLDYGSASESGFTGRGKYYDRLESVISGEIRTTADATGSLILPGNDTLSSVIRVHIRKTETARYIPISSGFTFEHPTNDSLFSGIEPEIITTNTYQWYEEGYRYPVFETIETYRDDLLEKIFLSKNTYFYHPAEQAYLPEDTVNIAVLERKLAARNAKMLEKKSNVLSFDCRPNPVKDRLEIELTLRKATTVEAGLWNTSGRLIQRFPSRTDVTDYREALNMQSFPPGYYLVKVIAGKETVSEKIVKN